MAPVAMLPANDAEPALRRDGRKHACGTLVASLRGRPSSAAFGRWNHRRFDARMLICRHAAMYFKIVGEITHAETFAIGSSNREVARLRTIYGRGR